MMKKEKTQLRKLAREFNLKYDKNWFDIMWISKRHARYLEYVGMCFDPIYTRFGKTIEKRIENIDKFESSKELKKILKRYGGQAITKKEVVKGIKDCKNIKNIKLSKELLSLHKRIQLNLKEDNLALLTKTKTKQHKEFLLNLILIHEWIHFLLMKNNIYFKSISEKHWKYDEGLVTYLEYYIKNRLGYLESMKRKTEYPMTKIYYIYAIKFRKILRDKKTPKERKQSINNLMKKLEKLK